MISLANPSITSISSNGGYLSFSFYDENPIDSVTYQLDGGIYNNLTYSDAYYYNNGAWQGIPNTYDVGYHIPNLTAGTHSINVVVTDTVGNVLHGSTTFDIAEQIVVEPIWGIIGWVAVGAVFGGYILYRLMRKRK